MITYTPMMRIRRLSRQHKSLVIVLPRCMWSALGLDAGRYVRIDCDPHRREITITPIATEDPTDVRYQTLGPH